MTFHMHSNFSDGRSTPEEMIQKALSLGWKAVGLTDHAPVDFDTFWTMKPERLPEYLEEIKRLQNKYAGQIEIYTGLECDWRESGAKDFYHDPRLDYEIGSFHFFEHQNKDWPIDGSLEEVTEGFKVLFNNQGRAFCERYYQGVLNLVEKKKPAVVGHLDLLKKHNSKLHFYQESDAWYQALVDQVLAAIQASGSILEVNTGGMARGYIQEPYPSWKILEKVRKLNIPIQLNSDSHHTDTIDAYYKETRARLVATGFSRQRILLHRTWVDIPL